jgi:GT2 family glycosyltransferase
LLVQGLSASLSRFSQTYQFVPLAEDIAQLKLSVIIPVFNGSAALGRCMQSIAASRHSPHEVLVVGDQVAHSARQRARSLGFMVYGQGEQRGRWLGRNLGAALSSGEILVFVDPEVCLREETLSQIADHFSEDPPAVVVGIPASGPLRDEFAGRYRNGRIHHAGLQSSDFVPWTWPNFMAMERGAFFQLGGFRGDFNLPLHGYDMEFGRRVTRAGFSIFLDKKLEVDYEERLSLGRIFRDDFRASSAALRSALASRGRDESPSSAFAYVPTKFLVSVLLATLTAVSLAISPWISWAPRWVLLWLLLYVLAEVRLLRFYRDTFGGVFVGKALLVSLVDYLACGLGMVVGAGQYWRGR